MSEKKASKATNGKRRRAPPCAAAMGGLTWGDELDGGQADPGRARALGALVEDLLVVDDADADAARALLERHMLDRGGLDADADAPRSVIRATRRLVVAASLALAGDADARRSLLAADKARGSTSRRKKPENVKARRRALMQALEAYRGAMMTHDELAGVLVELDASLLSLPASKRRGKRLQDALSALAPDLSSARSPELAAAKLSTKLDLFGDAAKDLTKVREQYRQARR